MVNHQHCLGHDLLPSLRDGVRDGSATSVLPAFPLCLPKSSQYPNQILRLDESFDPVQNRNANHRPEMETADSRTRDVTFSAHHPILKPHPMRGGHRHLRRRSTRGALPDPAVFVFSCGGGEAGVRTGYRAFKVSLIARKVKRGRWLDRSVSDSNGSSSIIKAQTIPAFSPQRTIFCLCLPLTDQESVRIDEPPRETVALLLQIETNQQLQYALY